jgi:basic membrane protein A
LSIQGQIRDTSAATDASIAVVFSTGGLGDQSFNDAANEGLQNAKTDFASITTASTEPADVPEINAAIEGYAVDGTYDLIIAIGFSSAAGVNASALAHPSQHYMIIDAVVDLPNVASITFKEHEGSFLVGALAAMVSETGSIAFLGGLDIPLINKFRAGYEQGAKYINPDIELAATYSPSPDNPWNDQAGGKTVAEDFIQNGADVIYAAAGGTGIGVFDAADEATTASKSVYAIGVDSNQDHLKEGIVLTSMVKRVDVAVYGQIKAVVEDTWTASIVSLGLAEDGVGITDMQFTQTEKNAEYSTGVTNYEKVLELKQMIIDGDIVVDETLPESTKSDSPVPVVPVLFAIIAIGIITRKRRFN